MAITDEISGEFHFNIAVKTAVKNYFSIARLTLSNNETFHFFRFILQFRNLK